MEPLEQMQSGKCGLEGLSSYDDRFEDLARRWCIILAALADKNSPPQASIRLHGILQNYNTIEDFKRTDLKKNAFNALVDSVSLAASSPCASFTS